jgi:hypothetical protein
LVATEGKKRFSVGKEKCAEGIDFLWFGLWIRMTYK